MGVLPVPEEVRSMHTKIEALTELVSHQNKLIRKLTDQIQQLKSQDKKIDDIGQKFTEINRLLTIISDTMRFTNVA